MNTERQAQAKQYARIRHRLLALNLAASALALLFVLASGLSVWFRDLVLAITPDPYLSTFIYFAVGMLGYILLFSPLTFYSEFIVPHKFGISRQSFGSWLLDMLKGVALLIVLGGIVIEMVYYLLRATPQWWWLISAVLVIFATVVLAALMPILILPLFFKFQPLQDAELVERLRKLATNAHTRVNGVYTMVMSDKTSAANAAFMGIGRTKRIVLGDTLYANFTYDEIETIMAHELAHQVHNDILWGMVIQSALTVVGFYVANLFMVVGVAFFGFESIADLAAMPLLGLAITVYGVVTLPLGNWYSRRREESADRYALETTRNPAAFISAFEKLADQNLAELEPEPWVVWLLYDHPPIGKRLEMGQAFQTPA